MSTVNAYAAPEAGQPLQPFTYELGQLGPSDIDIAVEYCGICHSDLSMLNNDWQMTAYPFVPGHEVIGTVKAIGDAVTTIEVGQRVGLGWFSKSCMHCTPCMSGDHNMCTTAEGTIIERHGGFADHVRCSEEWAVPLPDDLRAEACGPLFCGGITVFSPLLSFDVKPTDRVGVIGIGGLGHLALQFLNAWGCEVTAFTSSESKAEEARKMGAHRIVNSRDESALEEVAGQYHFIMNTTNVALNWQLYLQALAPKGRFHTVGAVLEPMEIPAFGLIMGRKAVSGSPLGSPEVTRLMLEFCARHNIQPVIETFPMSKVNDAMAHLEAGKARYRVVLQNDW